MESMLASTIVLLTITLVGWLIYRGIKAGGSIISDLLATPDSPSASETKTKSRATEADRPASVGGTGAGASRSRPAFGKARARAAIAAPADPAKPAIEDPALPGSAAYWQDLAKREDDKHKAQLRAHVERAVLPISVDGVEALERSQAAHLAIKHVFPPRLPQRSMSYFGGHPIVPPNFDWPTIHNRQGLLERLHFMAQIDCSDIPDGPARDLLPDKGYLYFFAPLADTLGPNASHFVTRYEPGPAKAKWEPLMVGLVGPIARNNATEQALFDKRSYFDRVEIEFAWIDQPSDAELADRAHEGHLHDVAETIRSEKVSSFHGPPIAQDAMFLMSSAPHDSLWIPHQGFPANWKTARLLRTFLESYVSEERADIERRLKDLGVVGNDHPEILRLSGLKSELSAFTSKMFTPFFATINVGLKEFAAPPADVKKQILDFLEEVRVHGIPSSIERHYSHLRLPSLLNNWIAAAAIHGAEGGLGDQDGAVLIPSDVVTALAPRHAARDHRMLGLGRIVQVAADEMKESHVLLLQLGSDIALDWLIGEMGPLQYWITPDDLAAKRFANTVLTIEAY